MVEALLRDAEKHSKKTGHTVSDVLLAMIFEQIKTIGELELSDLVEELKEMNRKVQ